MLKKILSSANLTKIRNKKIIQFFDWNILELWCGWWFIPNYLREKWYNNKYTGIDFMEKAIEKLSTDFPSYSFINHDLDEFLELNFKFDTIITTAVIEHIYNQKNFFFTAVKNLKIGGRIIITTPSNFGNDIIYPLMCKLGIRNWKWVLADHITIYNKDRFLVAAHDFWLELEKFEFFEFFCNQLIVFKKTKTI